MTKVYVYFNLHKKLWSIRAMEGPDKGRVIGHARTVLLGGDVKPKVSQAGRERVLRERKKNVHAGITGQLVFSGDLTLDVPENARAVTYNPYKYSGFVHADDESDFPGSSWALMMDKKVYAS